MPAYSDFKDLRDTLYKTNVGVLELDNLGSTDSVGDVLNRNRQYNPILDIMRHSSIKSMTSPFTKDFFTRSTLFSRNDDFSNLRNFSTSPIHQELPYIGHILSKAPNLTTLTLAMEIDIWVDTFNAIVEYQTYPIAFKHWNSELSLHIPTPATESRGSKRTLKDKDEFFRIHGQGIEQWVDYYPEATEMEAIVQGTQNGSRLKTFVLERGTDLGEERIKSLASIVAHSELHTLKLQLRGEEGRIRILESIPWTHIRELSIRLDRTGQLTSVTKALLGGMEKVASERLELEFFHLYSGSGEISVDEQNLLRSFISSMAFRRLRLNIPLDPGQAVELMRLVDMSRLQKLWLSMQGSDSSDVQKILDSLQHATEIQTMLLEYADITEDQREMIKAKGITLEYWEQ
ncbi:hypothetical protein B0O80DRAFT_442362 [Mortierella sp. GBAus27b]|nr:hypothetical protein B0O80DRAFT_442362 [Mortierella sp. GBAus27b]